MRLVQVFGPSGSGVSSIGRELAARLAVPMFDLDSYHWTASDPPYTMVRDPGAKFSLLESDLKLATRGLAILAGSLVGWAEQLRPAIVAAAWLECPAGTRVRRIRAREAARFGSRIAPAGDMHMNHVAFLHWASTYDSTSAEDARSRAADASWFVALDCVKTIVDTGERSISSTADAIEPLALQLFTSI